MSPGTRPPASHLPARIAALPRILQNLWWTWSPPALSLLESVDAESWRLAGGFPMDFIRRVRPSRWTQLARDTEFLSRLDAVEAELKDYLAATDTWWTRAHPGEIPNGIGYFSAEFGVHESLPVYSGGLGVLAGDHLKSASDLGLPMVAVGLFYREGYFRQRIDDDEQVEEYPHFSPSELGLQRALGAGGQPLEVYVPLYDRYVRCEVWRADVGRVPLLLLDTDVVGNRDEDRWLTRRLYGGDPRTRICQEVVLGIGGLRALRIAGYSPEVIHLNEGHTAFVVLERLREQRVLGRSAEGTWRTIRASTIFTTHTPVAAGHDRFAAALVDEVLHNWREQIGLSPSELMDLGRVQTGSDETLCMTALAMKSSRSSNAVSRKHGEVTRVMWQGIWPGRAPEMVPIAHITNGVHAPSWLGHPVRSLLDAELGPDWERWLAGGERLAGVDAVDDGDLWAAHRAQKRRLLDFIAFRSGETLDENALLLGFARRFAPYKRGDLLLSEPLRLAKLLGNPEQPGYLVYGGKSHPRDEPGKAIIRRVIEASRLPGLEGRVLFLEDYDIGVGRALVQGVDVWVNNPRRPLEASGTSGQKVAMNGGLNVSTLDGWWLEAYEQQPLAGWAVGEAEPATDDGVGDKADGEAMYRVMEDEVFPTYFRRDESGLPRDWIKRMKKAIATCLPAYNTDRMVADYVEYAYVRPSNPDATVV